MAMETLEHGATIRKARKGHTCTHGRWERRVKHEPAICPGDIQPGERYVECYDFGEPYHPARYHVACWKAETS
jgi:hypothetical protein